MNKTLVAVTLSALLAATQTQARPRDSFVDQGRVIASTPIYETVRVSEPVETCHDRPLPPPPHHDPALAGTLTGGLVGGVIGNQFGHGSGRGAMTAVGTLVGAVIGNGLARDHHHHRRPPAARQRVCEVVDQYRYEERLVGYRVEYRYKGQTFFTRTSDQPGRYVPVRVEVNALNSY
jgi:uncharacterized protein YcfJ